MAKNLRRFTSAILIVAIAGTACSSSDTETAGPSSSATTTEAGPTTTGEPTIEGSLPTTSTTIDSSTTSTSTTTEAPPAECSAPTYSHLVDVEPDDPDGGLNLRVDPGSDNDIILPLPAGTEVVPSGDCVESGDAGEWWAVAAATDDSVTGWVAASFLTPRPDRVECPSELAPLEGLGDLTLTRADMDGDGELDRVYIGTDTSQNTARMLVEFDAGGLAQGDLSVPIAAEVAFAFRPIGAHHDIVMYRDAFGGGASTSRFVFAEVADCEVRDFGSVEAGASAGWGSLGFCLEETPLGVRHWVYNAVGDTAEEGEANRVDDPFHYYEGEFVPGTGELEGRECIDSESPASFRLAPSFVDTRGVGTVAPTVEELVDAIAAVIGSNEDSSISLVGEPVGVDAQGGFVTFDVIGLRDDSIGGWRVQLEFGTVLSDDTPSGLSAERVVLTAFCTRGVTEDGWCI